MAETWSARSSVLIDPNELETTYLLRGLLEPYAMKRATARLPAGALSMAWRINGEIALAVQRGDAASILEADRRLHFYFYDLCGSAGLAQQIGALWAASCPLLRRIVLHRQDGLLREHDRLLEAIAAGDQAAVSAATAAHVRSEHAALVRDLTGSRSAPPLFTVAQLQASSVDYRHYH